MPKYARRFVLFSTALPQPYNKIGDGPEGPEARTVADKLRPYLVTRSITNARKDERAKTLGFNNLKCPAQIIGVRSYGKKVLIDLSTGHVIIFSLGMGGRLQYTPGNHSHVYFELSDNHINGAFRVLKPVFTLYFDDQRYMGSVDIIPVANISLYFMNMGPDLLQSALDENTWIPLDTWLAIYTKKESTRMICDILMDQDLVAGMGWYLITEILYYAGIHPERRGNMLTHEDWDRIRICAHKVIRLSYSYGGFTIESFISPDGTLGMYPAAIYGKHIDVLGNIIMDRKLKNDRTIHWVPALQK